MNQDVCLTFVLFYFFRRLNLQQVQACALSSLLLFVVNLENLARKGHFRLAHIDHKYEHTKSKFRGPFRRPKYLEIFIKNVVTACTSLERRRQHFVHEVNAAGEDIFSYQFFIRNNSDVPEENITGIFVAGDPLQVWNQRLIEAWFNHEGELHSLFPSGTGRNGQQDTGMGTDQRTLGLGS